MSDKNYLYSPTHSSLSTAMGTCLRRVVVSSEYGTSKNNTKETQDEMNTMNNGSATHLLQHSNVPYNNQNKKKHHNFDQAFESTTTAWRQIFLDIVSAKIKILFLFFTALLSTWLPLSLQTQHCHFFASARLHTQKFNYTRRLRIPRVTLLLLLSIVLQQIHVISCIKQNHFVHWNTSNPIFRIDNTDHIIDVNHGNKPWEYDQVNIICPVYPAGRRHESEIEKYIIYSVTKEEYETCRITNPNPRTIAVCNKPYELMYFTITFRSFTPTPGGMEFKPGQNYYFISTSSKDDLYRRVGGHCSTHHMKIEFKIANNKHETHSTKIKAVNVARRRRPVRPSYPRPGSFYSTEDSDDDTVIINTDDSYNYKQFPNYKGYYDSPDERRLSYPTYNNDRITSYYENQRYPPHTRLMGEKGKKRNEYDIHPNDVIKHEASRMAAATSSAKASNYYIHCDANKMVLFLSFVAQMLSFGFGLD